MLFLQLDPFSRPVAITEMLILLFAAAFTGWLIARLIYNQHSTRLLREIEDTRSELNDCHSLQQRDKKTFAGGQQIFTPVQAGSLRTAAFTKDDLKIVEGIGPKVEEVMNNAGIITFEQLSNTSPATLLEILTNAGRSYQMLDPESWPAQARLARMGKWQELELLKSKLDGGRQM
jgi:predicted flap endonuclease-1-like 5' DNA nuclease